MSPWTHQDILTAALVAITAIYVWLTWQLVKSAQASGATAEQLTRGIDALVKTIGEQSQLLQYQYELSFKQYNDSIAAQNIKAREARFIARDLLTDVKALLEALETGDLQEGARIVEFGSWYDNHLYVLLRALEDGRPVQPAVSDRLRERLTRLITLAGPRVRNPYVVTFPPDELASWVATRDDAVNLIEFILDVIQRMEDKYYPQENVSTTANEGEKMSTED